MCKHRLLTMSRDPAGSLKAYYTCQECDRSWLGKEAPGVHVFYRGAIVREGYKDWFDAVIKATEKGYRGRNVVEAPHGYGVLENGVPIDDAREVYKQEIDNTPIPDNAGVVDEIGDALQTIENQ